MVRLIYDGSFEGFLTAVFTVYEKKLQDCEIQTEDRDPGLFLGQTIQILTDVQRFRRVKEGMIKKISPLALRNVIYCFYCREPEIETLLLAYLREGFLRGNACNHDPGFDAGVKVNRLASRVSFEVHRLQGLIRFKEIKPGLFYAGFEPDHDVLGFLVSHFCRRFASQDFILHDRQRKKAAVFEKGRLSFLALEGVESFFQDDFEGLWQQYFKSIAIEERKNPRLQKQFMPARYWKYLTEKQ